MRFLTGSAVAFSLILTPPFTGPARADRASAIIGGALGVIILNEANKSQKKQRKKMNPAQAGEPAMDRATKQQVQSALNILGFDAGIADGVFGKGTRASIRRYQSKYGYLSSGYLTTAQLEQLQQAYFEAEASGNPRLDRPLTRGDLRQLQKSLKDLGYYSGRIDGVAGRGTDRAISGYLVDRNMNPATTPTYEVLVMAGEESGVRPRQAGEPKQGTAASSGTVVSASNASSQSGASATHGSAFSTESYDLGRKDPAFDRELFLSRHLLKKRPDLIDSDGAAQHWIKKEFPQKRYGQGDALATSMTAAYYDGSSFERQDALAGLRRQIQSTEPAYPLPYKMEMGFQIAVDLGGFVPGKGVPVRSAKNRSLNGNALLKSERLHLDPLNRYLQFYFETNLDVDYIPLTQDQARALASRVQGEHFVRFQMNRYVTLTDIEALEEVYYGSNTMSVAGASLDAVTITLNDTRDGRLLDTVHTWNASDAKAPQDAGGLEAYAKWLGLPMHKEHLVRYAGLGQPSNDPLLKQNFGGWQRLGLMAKVAANPAILDDDDNLVNYAGWVLSEAQKREAAQGKPLFNATGRMNYGRQALNQFEFHAAVKNLRENYLEDILKRRPQYPLKAVEVTEYVLGEYDFGAEWFAISTQYPPGFKRMHGQLAINAKVRKYPTTLEVPLSEAEGFADMLKNVNPGAYLPPLYLAHFVTLDNPQANGQSTSLRANTSHLAMFADRALTQHLFDIEASDGWRIVPSDAAQVLRGKGNVWTSESALMYLASLQPEKLEDRAFLKTVLGNMQAHQNAGTASPFNGILPDHLLGRRIEITEHDWHQIQTALKTAVAALDFETLQLVYPFNAKPTSDGQLLLNLDTHLQRAASGAEGDSELEIVRNLVPDADGIYQIPSSKETPFFVALKNAEGLLSVGAPMPKSSDAGGQWPGTLELKITKKHRANWKSGRSLVVFEAEPTKVVLKDGPNQKIVDLQDRDAVAAAKPQAAKRKILGVELGMSLAKAEEVIAENLPEGLTRKALGGVGEGLNAGVAYYDMNGRSAWSHIALFQKDNTPSSPVTAITRLMSWTEEDGVTYEDVLTALIDTYGAPDITNDGRLGRYTWFESPQKTADIKRQDRWGNQCNPNSLDSLKLPYASAGMLIGGSDTTARLEAREVTQSCGEVLTVTMEYSWMLMSLVDTDAIIAERTSQKNLEAEKAAEDAAKAKKAKKLKF
nr:peptidoglycan-binding protein [uncultured Shimia sp.]